MSSVLCLAPTTIRLHRRKKSLEGDIKHAGVLIAAAVLLVFTFSGAECTQDLLKWWKMPDPEAGRIDVQHHSPRCCTAEDCLVQSRGDRAFVTTLRSPEYLVLLRELHCSIQKHNPGVHLIVLAVAADLHHTVIDEIWTMGAEYREIEEFAFPNEWFPRFSKNWAKLRAWNLTDLDAVVLLDADVVLQGDVRHLFRLPTDFAWVSDAGPGAYETHSGGLIFLRPCRAVADDMIKTIQERPELRAPTLMAEQSFLSWYFRYAGLRLPSMYNTNFEIWLRHTGQLTAGGERPLALHFSDRKLFEACPSDPEWRFLCHRPRLVAAGNHSAPGVNCSRGSGGGKIDIKSLQIQSHNSSESQD